VAARLHSMGHKVLVNVSGAAAKTAREIGCEPVSEEELLERCPTLVGASTTGPILDGKKLQANKILIDLALPPTLTPKSRPKALRVYAGEPLQVPGRIRASFWGRLWLFFARYGRGCIYACFAEPIIALLEDAELCRTQRRLTLSEVEMAGAALVKLGFTPILKRR